MKALLLCLAIVLSSCTKSADKPYSAAPGSGDANFSFSEATKVFAEKECDALKPPPAEPPVLAEGQTPADIAKKTEPAPCVKDCITEVDGKAAPGMTSHQQCLHHMGQIHSRFVQGQTKDGIDPCPGHETSLTEAKKAEQECASKTSCRSSGLAPLQEKTKLLGLLTQACARVSKK